MRVFLKRALLALLLLAGVLYGAFALTSHPVEPHPYFETGDVLVIAHRGGKGLAPENTLTAFARSVALGVDVLEMDLRQSRDGALIVLHDRRVDRTTNGQGAADSLSLAQLKQLDAGYHFSPSGQTFPYRGQGVAIPTLAEVFTAFPNTRFLIEIKDDSAALARDFCGTIRRFELSERVIAASFHSRPLAHLRQACPEVATSAAASAGMSFILLHWLRLDAAYHPVSQAFQFPARLGKIDLIDQRFIARAHAHNVHVHVWTINDPAAMQHYLALGVDGLITDYPDRLLRILNRQSTEEASWATQ